MDEDEYMVAVFAGCITMLLIMCCISVIDTLFRDVVPVNFMILWVSILGVVICGWILKVFIEVSIE